VTADSGFSLVEIHISPWDAHVCRALLESEGIRAHLATEHHVWAHWSMSLTLGGVRVLVPTSDLLAAKAVLSLRDSGDLQAALIKELAHNDDAANLDLGNDVCVRNDWISICLALVMFLACSVIYPPRKTRIPEPFCEPSRGEA
jgi:hypothetical protein